MGIDNTIQGLPRVSASKIRVYRTCQMQYKYKYLIPWNSRPEDDKNVAALLGTALHEAIEMYYKTGANATATFQRVMEDTITEWEDKKLKINAASYYATAMKVGKEILRSFDWSKFSPIELEYEFTLPFPNKQTPLVNMTGYIDLIDISGKVVDHKSSSTVPNQNELDNDPQFIIYAWAYEQIYNTRPNAVIWNHLRTGKLYEANVFQNFDDKLQQLTNDITAMLENKYHARRKLDKVCLTECSFYVLCYGEKSSKVEDN